MMPFLVSFFTWFGGAFTWFMKDFIPRIAKRLGLGVVLGAIQKTISLIVVAFVLVFFGLIINFAINMFNALSNFINYLSSVSGSGSWASCAVYMIQVSGIAAGIQMAAPFYLGVVGFFFIYAGYKIMHIVLKTISDETSKTIESTK